MKYLANVAYSSFMLIYAIYACLAIGEYNNGDWLVMILNCIFFGAFYAQSKELNSRTDA